MINLYNKAKMIVLLSFLLFTYNLSAFIILPEVRVKNEIVTLEDIVWTLDENVLHKLENIEVGRIRIPGGRIILRKNTVLSKLSLVDISNSKIEIPDRIIIERAFSSLKKTDLDEIIRVELSKVYGDTSYDYKIDIAIGEIVRMPIGNLSYYLDKSAQERILGRRDLTLLVYEEDKEVYRIPFNLDVGKYIKEYTLKRDVKDGDEFSTALVDIKEEFVYEESQLNSFEYKEGQIFTKTLLAGTKLNSSHLDKKSLIKKDENVQIYLNFGNMQVRDKGIALDSGDIGDEIRVKNIRTEKTIRGIIRKDKSVEIVSY